MKIYLAHPFGARHHIRNLQSEWVFKYKHEFINPFYDSAVEQVMVKQTDDGKIDYFTLLGMLDAKKIVEEDLKMIEVCDAIIAYIDGTISYGTIMEIVYAKMMGKKIVIVVTNGYENHPWIRYHADSVYLTSAEMAEGFLG